MKKTWFLILFVIAACSADNDKEKESLPCGFENLPHQHSPVECGVNPWTLKGDCCTWITLEDDQKCVTAWCYNEYLCEWSVNQRSCK